MNWVAMLEWVTKWKYGYWEFMKCQNKFIGKRGASCMS